MNLTDLLVSVDVLEVAGTRDKEIGYIFFDSRKATPGGLFVALRGLTADGHSYIPSVIEAGVTSVVCESLPQEFSEGVCYIKVVDTNVALGTLAANFFRNPTQQMTLIGVTGTNGKTTTATSLFRLFRRLGYKAGLFSTIENRIEETRINSTHTTPDAIQLQELARKMVDSGCTHCFMEVSSHAVDQQRIAGLNFAGGIFSNLTHDHLDYHKTMEGYFLAKKKFFDELPSTAFCLTNIDDPVGLSITQDTSARRFAYSLRGKADFSAKIILSDLAGTSIEVDGTQVSCGLRGDFNAYNMLAVYACAMVLGESVKDIAEAFDALEPVRGRFDAIPGPSGIFGVVDFAHSPDSLLNILSSIRKTIAQASRIVTVVGCGGDRDREKRPIMGSIAYENSDLCIFTSDNPRSENPESILSQIRDGLPPNHQTKAYFMSDRRAAIRYACAQLKSGDVVLVAGKGHENYQEVNGTKFPFDDRLVLSEELSSIEVPST